METSLIDERETEAWPEVRPAQCPLQQGLQGFSVEPTGALETSLRTSDLILCPHHTEEERGQDGACPGPHSEWGAGQAQS